MIKKFIITSFMRCYIASCAIVLSGCTFPSLFETIPTATGNQPIGKSLAETRMERIIAKQQRLFKDLESKLATASSFDQQQRINEVDTAYRAFILDNPDYIYGFILYGKFLRTIGDFETANIIFVKANELAGDYAVIKQQIGNYLAEEAEYGLALAYLFSAVELEPNTALYHFQVGELLHTYRYQFIESEKLDAEVLARQQLTAFENAARLEPHNRIFQMRYAEAFFDAQDPYWPDALSQWQRLEKNAEDETEREIIQLQKARVYIELDEYDNAQACLAQITRTALQNSKELLLDRIAHREL